MRNSLGLCRVVDMIVVALLETFAFEGFISILYESAHGEFSDGNFSPWGMQGLIGGNGCLAMDTSAEENHSRENSSSGEEQEQDDITEAHVEDLGFLMGVTTIDPEPHRCRSPFYSFTSVSHELMVSSILACRYATAAEILEADSSFVEALGRDKARSAGGIEGRWKVFQDRVHAQVDSSGNRQLFFKSTSNKLIAHTGQWQEIVHTFHVDENNRHFGVSGTLDRIRQLWITDTRRHGIPEPFLQALIALCPVCNPREKITSSLPLFEGNRTRPPKFTFPVQLEVPVKVLPQKLEALAIEHKVVLRVLRSKRIALCPFLSEVVSYICHRGQFKRLREKKERSILEKRRFKASFRCGCNYRIKTLIPISNYSSETGSYDYQTESVAIVLLNPVHTGHEPGSEGDLLHLPVHSSAIRECEEDRSDMKEIHGITRSSLRKSPLLKAQASELEQATFRFFLTKKETQRLPYYRKSKEKLLKDMAGDMHLKHHETDTLTKVDTPPKGPNEVKDILSLTEGIQNSWSPCMPPRRLGFQKVLARLTDGKHASSMTDQLRTGPREAEAAIYYSRQKQGICHSGRTSARRNQGTQMRWIKDSEYPERYGRDSSRLDLVNKGISLFNKLQLSDEIEAEKPVEETVHVLSDTLDCFEKEFNHHAGDSTFKQAGGAISNPKSLREGLNFSGSTEQTDSLAPNKRSSFGRQIRIHYMSTQPSDTSSPVRVIKTFIDGEIGGHDSVSPAKVLSPHCVTRTKKNVGRKRKRNSVCVHTCPLNRPPKSDCDF